MKRNHLIALLLIVLFSQQVMAQNENVSFSRSGGFYDDGFSLALSCSNSDLHVRYTTNGATPTSTSTLYTEPLLLDSNMYSHSDIYTIVNCIPSTFYLSNDVKHAIVIRAAAFDADGNRFSDVVTQSYFIRSLDCNTHGLPVMSLVADSLDLFDYNTGIFVPGASYDSSDSTHTGNYYNRGIEWERLINVEFYETNNEGINQQCGLRAHGGASRWFQQKGMKLYARDEYGKKRFKHQFFDDIPHNSFKRLNLKPFRCSNWLQTGGQDYLANRIAHNFNLESPAVREVVVFLNGEYWGIYTLEETPDERYLEDHFNINIDSCNVIKYWGTTEYGDGMDWWRLRNWMADANLNNDDDYAYACSRVDEPCFIDYEMFQIFSHNLDWPVNNTLCWQAANGQPFRFIFYDGDGCFSKLDFDAWGNATDSLWHFSTSSPHATLFFRKFMQNKAFKEAFVVRFMELKDTHFSYQSMHNLWQYYCNSVSDEIQNVSDRFHFPVSYERWETDTEQTDCFLKLCTDLFENQLLEYFDTEEMELPAWSCYPNPFKNEFIIELPENQVNGRLLQIFDLNGRECFRQEFPDDCGHIGIEPEIPAGFYLLKLGNVSQIIVKE